MTMADWFDLNESETCRESLETFIIKTEAGSLVLARELSLMKIIGAEN